MTVNIRNHRGYDDALARAHARKRRRALALRMVLCAVIIVGGTWVIFGSSVFAITDVVIRGASTATTAAISADIQDALGRRTLGFLRPARNIAFFSTADAHTVLASKFPGIEALSIEKRYPHQIYIEVTERTPIGIWCHGDVCSYVDEQGVLWGQTLVSQGPLLLFVDDEAQTDSQQLRRDVLGAVAKLSTMGLRARSVKIVGDAGATMSIKCHEGPELLIDAQADIDEQLHTLQVLLSEKALDTLWKPNSIDLRVSGRIYYK